VNRLWRATINSWNGLVAAARTEEAFRQEIVIATFAIPLALWLTGDFARRVALIGSILIIMIVELLNTAVEKLCDRLTMDNDKAIGRVKDIASAAVGVSLLMAAALWLWVAFERFWLYGP
jgi:diacylglycerol kinase (ATP)